MHDGTAAAVSVVNVEKDVYTEVVDPALNACYVHQFPKIK